MIVIDADAVDSQSTVVVVLDTALVAHAAVVHPGEFVDLAFITKAEPSSV